MLEHAGGSEIKSLGVASASGKVAELFCRNSFDGTAVDMSSASRRLFPKCQTFCDLIMLVRDANGVNEVKHDNLVERCVRRLEEKEMYELERNAGGCSCMRTRGTDGLVGSASSRKCVFRREQVEIRVRHREVEHVSLQQRWADQDSREELRDSV